eukprot:jgi/Psemu1/96/gm1.96_g
MSSQNKSGRLLPKTPRSGHLLDDDAEVGNREMVLKSLVKHLKDFRAQLIESTIIIIYVVKVVEELNFLSSINIQRVTIKLIIGGRDGTSDPLAVVTTTFMANNLVDLKKGIVLLRDEYEKVVQLFNYYSPDMSKLSSETHKGIL